MSGVFNTKLNNLEILLKFKTEVRSRYLNMNVNEMDTAIDNLKHVFRGWTEKKRH